MKFKLLILLIVLMSAVFVSASVPVNVTWSTATPSGGTIASIPFPGFSNAPTPPDPTTASTVVEALAQIDKKLVDGIFK